MVAVRIGRASLVLRADCSGRAILDGTFQARLAEAGLLGSAEWGDDRERSCSLASVPTGSVEDLHRRAHPKWTRIDDQRVLGKHDLLRHSSISSEGSKRLNSNLARARIHKDR